MIKVKPYISELAKYSPPWSGIDRKKYLRFDLNENTLNPPAHVKKSLTEYINADKIQIYPDYRQFTDKLCSYAGVNKENIIPTNGSDQAIEIILRAFLEPEDKMIIARPGFPMFEQISGVIGAKIIGIPYNKDMSFPYKSFVSAIKEDTKLIVLVNPDNPTGSGIELEQIKEILTLNPNIPVIADEAYFEFTGKTALPFLEEHQNLIITRTFSKAFAMAGLRLGYIMANPDIISQFYKIRGPFDVNSCALIAASSQIDFQNEWKNFVKETMTISKPYLEDFFDEHNVSYYRGSAHFMLVKPNNRDKAVDFLKQKGILVRPMFAPLIQETFRMSLGTFEQTREFTEVYKEYLSL